MKHLFREPGGLDLPSPALSWVAVYKSVLSAWDLITLLLTFLDRAEHSLQGLFHYLLITSSFSSIAVTFHCDTQKVCTFYPLEIHQMQAQFSYFVLVKSDNPFPAIALKGLFT